MQILSSGSKKSIVYITIGFRMLQYAIVAVCPMQFDVSNDILIEVYSRSQSRYPIYIQEFLKKTMSWDCVYFLKLALVGIDYEHEWVFSPLWWRLLSLFKVFGHLDIFDMALIAIVINNLVLIGTSIVLYKLALVVGQNEFFVKDPKKFAFTSALILTFQPSGIFSLVPYAETISQFLCYLALYWRQISLGRYRIKNKRLYEFSGMAFALAYGFRSNCLLYGILYIYDVIKYPYWRSKLTSLLTGNVMLMSLLYSIWVPYNYYCPKRGEWCESFSKSLVSYAQSYYWGNGFLNYYTPNNIPNFLFALPQIIILGFSLIVFSNWESLRAEVIVTGVYLFLQVTCMHVQIINRVSTFVPLHLFYVAHLLNRGKTLGKIILCWWCVWVLVQAGLFAAFLPPA